MTDFPADVVRGVLAHMNDDHTDDSLVIVRAFGRPDATAATMIGLDADGGEWEVTESDATHVHRVAWPSAPISERAEIRREVVALYDAACLALGTEARPH